MDNQTCTTDIISRDGLTRRRLTSLEIALITAKAADFPRLSTPTGSVERVTTFKLLGNNFEATFLGLSIGLVAQFLRNQSVYFLKQLNC